MRQNKQIIKIMEENGGYATLGYLYQVVETKDWKTKTPFASIRRIVQDGKYFFKIRPGLWALNEHRDAVLKKFNLETGKRNDDNTFNHTYYQGLIVEIGNMQNFKTFVPHQDKNKLFLERPLKTICGIETIYEFSYSTILQRAKTIDVIWFNNRRLPHAFFEVEYSTDFQNSLGKYSDLQDFNCKLFLVSSAEKKRRFEDIIKRGIFNEIKQRVQFLDFNYISALHAKTIEIIELQKVVKL